MLTHKLCTSLRRGSIAGASLYTSIGWKGKLRNENIETGLLRSQTESNSEPTAAYAKWFNSVDASVSVTLPGLLPAGASIGGAATLFVMAQC